MEAEGSSAPGQQNENNKNNNTQLLEELEALSQTMYQSHVSSTRRTASLVLPRSSIPSISEADRDEDDDNNGNSLSASVKLNPKPRSRRMSLSPWRSRPKHQDANTLPSSQSSTQQQSSVSDPILLLEDDASSNSTSQKKNKGIWSTWKPLRALSHIGMQKLSCLFSVEVVAAQGLPASMNGLRLSVCVRKKESKDGAVHTMPSTVSQGAADFEETLFLKCHVYHSPPTPPSPAKFEPRPFLIYAFAVDAPELDFGRGSVDLSRLIQDSVEKSSRGERVRQWDTGFKLSGKAKGGELVVKLGFQVMEKDGGIGIYGGGKLGDQSAAATVKSRKMSTAAATAAARKQSKTSFSIPSPKMSSGRMEVWTPTQPGSNADHLRQQLQGIDDLNLDDPAVVSYSTINPPKQTEDLDLPDFEVVDKGIELQEHQAGAAEEEEEDQSREQAVDDKSGPEIRSTTTDQSSSSEVIKEVVHDDHVHLTRLTELDSIAQQIKALESMMGDEEEEEETGINQEAKLDADEETVTREFLQMLEYEEFEEEEATFKMVDDYDVDTVPSSKKSNNIDNNNNNSSKKKKNKLKQVEQQETSEVYLPDLGKGLGCVVQTKNGGYLAAMNPLNVPMGRKETPKLAMQLSKPLVIVSSLSGFELLQRMAAGGLEALSSEAGSRMPVDHDLMGKTPEQVAFEGIASAIIHGRNKEEGASSSAARTVASVKAMASAMSGGRKDRVATGLWNVGEEPVEGDEILPFAMQKIEAMAIDALKIQAGMSEEEAPFDVSPLSSGGNNNNSKKKKNDQQKKSPLASAISIEEWNENIESENEKEVTLAVLVQLHDPFRRYEAVGGLMMALIQATATPPEKKRFKVGSLHVGGISSSAGGKRNAAWDGEKQRLTAMQWLVAYGLGRSISAGRKGTAPQQLKGQDKVWSISSRIVADMWLKPIRNPNIKFTTK